MKIKGYVKYFLKNRNPYNNSNIQTLFNIFYGRMVTISKFIFEPFAHFLSHFF